MTERTANDYLAQAATERARWASALRTPVRTHAQRKPRSLFARLFGL